MQANPAAAPTTSAPKHLTHVVGVGDIGKSVGVYFSFKTDSGNADDARALLSDVSVVLGPSWSDESDSSAACKPADTCASGWGVLVASTKEANGTCQECVDGIKWNNRDDYTQCQGANPCAAHEHAAPREDRGDEDAGLLFTFE